MKRDHLEAEAGEVWRTRHGDVVLVLSPVPDEGGTDAVVHNITRHGLMDVYPTSITGPALATNLRVGPTADDEDEPPFPYIISADSERDLRLYRDAFEALAEDIGERVNAIDAELEHRDGD